MGDHDHSDGTGGDRAIGRRPVLAGAALVGVSALAGCLDGDDDEAVLPDPVTIESGHLCDNCTMEIVDYPGPIGQSVYEDPAAVLGAAADDGMDGDDDDGMDGDDGHDDGEMDDGEEADDGDADGDDVDRPARFCSGLCTYTFLFEHEDEQEPEVVYMTDYSDVDWEIDDGGEEPTISSHPEAEAFAQAEDLTMVVDSDVEGAMGADLIGFSDADEAEDFQDDHGGERYEHDEVTNELIMSLM